MRWNRARRFSAASVTLTAVVAAAAIGSGTAPAAAAASEGPTAREAARAKQDAAAKARERAAALQDAKQAQERARQQAQERARQQARERAAEQARERARQEAQERARERARQEAQERARQEAQERARQEARERAREQARERARQEAAERARQQARERAREAAEERAREAARRRAREAAEAAARERAAERAREEALRRQRELRERRGAEERREAYEDALRRQRELDARREALEALRRREAERERDSRGLDRREEARPPLDARERWRTREDLLEDPRERLDTREDLLRERYRDAGGRDGALDALREAERRREREALQRRLREAGASADERRDGVVPDEVFRPRTDAMEERRARDAEPGGYIRMAPRGRSGEPGGRGVSPEARPGGDRTAGGLVPGRRGPVPQVDASRERVERSRHGLTVPSAEVAPALRMPDSVDVPGETPPLPPPVLEIPTDHGEVAVPAFSRAPVGSMRAGLHDFRDGRFEENRYHHEGDDVDIDIDIDVFNYNDFSHHHVNRHFDFVDFHGFRRSCAPWFSFHLFFGDHDGFGFGWYGDSWWHHRRHLHGFRAPWWWEWSPRYRYTFVYDYGWPGYYRPWYCDPYYVSTWHRTEVVYRTVYEYETRPLPPPPPPTLDEAWGLLGERSYGLARDAFAEIAAAAPYEAEPRIGYAVAAGLMEDHPAAISSMRRAIENDIAAILDVPLPASARAEMGYLVDLYAGMARRNPSDGDALFMAGALQAARGDVGLAYFATEQAVDAGDDHPTTYQLLDFLRATMYDRMHR